MIGCVKTDPMYQLSGSMEEYIKPVKRVKISKRIQDITGITKEDISEKGISFQECLEKLEQFIDGKETLFIAYGDYDLKILNKSFAANGIEDKSFINKIRNNYLDLSTIATILFTGSRNQTISLKNAVEKTGVSFKGTEHNSLSDAYNLYLIQKHLGENKQTLMVDLLKSLELSTELNLSCFVNSVEYKDVKQEDIKKFTSSINIFNKDTYRTLIKTIGPVLNLYPEYNKFFIKTIDVYKSISDKDCLLLHIVKGEVNISKIKLTKFNVRKILMSLDKPIQNVEIYKIQDECIAALERSILASDTIEDRMVQLFTPVGKILPEGEYKQNSIAIMRLILSRKCYPDWFLNKVEKGIKKCLTS